ncbi:MULTISPECIES: hypothetical protein [unclassified Spirosoma]|uniref:hypothetical protein n=1 Tax=unclassified Spirosoma TaxID=2621999 RepID=UPI000A865709|nr:MULTISPECIES: hypothetical protein [unclassified Spirosoma]MBN8824171.1 hypothetical protein [Spirosoma sp.]
MFEHWINELMNLLAGNSRYMRYSRTRQSLFLLSILAFLVITFLLIYFVDMN